jgi:hypothetical protein
VDKLKAGRFAGLLETSSSSLPVRSMIWAASRLLLEARTEDDTAESSRDAGVLRGAEVSSDDVSDLLISTRSSSSVFGVKLSVVEPFPLFGLYQLPFGSIVTCSTSERVDRRISSTYLECQQGRNTWRGATY